MSAANGMTEKKKILLLFGLALVARFIALPFSQITEADATSRLFLAEHALHNGGELASLQWQSLHIYFLSLAQLISGERFWGPVVFSMLLGAGSVIPFYLFTRNIFSRPGAFYAALLFTFSPLVFRFSFSPLSEIFYAFFTLMAFWALSEGITGEKKMKWALLGGLFMTIACGARFEPWLIAFLAGLILLALKEWKMFFLFGAASAVFPVYWMVFCYLKTGHAFASVDMIAYQNLVVGQEMASVDNVMRLRRLIFFPFSFLVCISPVVAGILFWLLPGIFRRMTVNKARAGFALMLIFMLCFSVYQSSKAMLITQHRYTLTLTMLAFPVWAVWFENGKRMKIKKIISFLLAATLIPWSFTWQNISWHRISLSGPDTQSAISHIVAETYLEIRAVPRLQNQEMALIADRINAELKPKDGLVLDWCGWVDSYYLAHRTRLPAWEMLISCEDNPQPVNYEMFRSYLEGHRNGLFLLSDFSTLSGEITMHGSLLEIPNVPGGILLEPVRNEAHYRLFRYKFLSPEETGIQRQKLNFTPPLYTIVKDVPYYEISARINGDWLTGLWQEAVKNHRPLDEQVHIAAEWMVEQDKLNQQNKDTLK